MPRDSEIGGDRLDCIPCGTVGQAVSPNSRKSQLSCQAGGRVAARANLDSLRTAADLVRCPQAERMAAQASE